MRILILIPLLFLASQLEARNYKGNRDVATAGSPLGAAYGFVMSFTRQVRSIACIAQNVDKAIFISYTGKETDCSDAVDDFPIPGGGSFVFEKDDIGGVVCAKTIDGTATTTGLLHCRGWWENTPQ